jgi:aquaporin Z
VTRRIIAAIAVSSSGRLHNWDEDFDKGVRMGRKFLAEVVLTALFIFVILAVTGPVGNAGTAGVVIGLTLTLVHLIGIPLTGTSVNPARSLGPALIVRGGALSQVWLFIIAPLVGGVVAAIVHAVLYPKVRSDLLVVEFSE